MSSRTLRTMGLAGALLLAAGPVRALEFGEVQAAGKRVTFCRVDLRKDRLQLFLNDGAGQPSKRFDPLAGSLRQKGQTLTFAMNAGMFHSGFAPVGLCLADGRTLAPLNTDSGKGNFFLKPNGVFCVSEGGAARVVETSEFPALADRMRLATQSGPLLVRAGALHPAFRADSTSRLIRNGVGVPSPDAAVFAISEEPVSFYEFAACFRDVLHCPDALYLDGTISGLYAPALRRNDARADLGPILGVTEP